MRASSAKVRFGSPNLPVRISIEPGSTGAPTFFAVRSDRHLCWWSAQSSGKVRVTDLAAASA
jgi:hypothetical protein